MNDREEGGEREEREKRGGEAKGLDSVSNFFQTTHVGYLTINNGMNGYICFTLYFRPHACRTFRKYKIRPPRYIMS